MGRGRGAYPYQISYIFSMFYCDTILERYYTIYFIGYFRPLESIWLFGHKMLLFGLEASEQSDYLERREKKKDKKKRKKEDL